MVVQVNILGDEVVVLVDKDTGPVDRVMVVEVEEVEMEEEEVTISVFEVDILSLLPYF